jgi:hypothetical protein
VTRQAARKVADGLQRRGYITTARDTRDTRQVNVILTPAGHDYAKAVTAVIATVVQVKDLIYMERTVAPRQGPPASGTGVGHPPVSTRLAWPCGGRLRLSGSSS